MSRKRFHVTAHALLRWIECVERIGVEAVRDREGGLHDGELLHHCETVLHLPVREHRRDLVRELFLVDAPAKGRCRIAGGTAVLKNGCLVTVLEDRKPEAEAETPRERLGRSSFDRESGAALRRGRGPRNLAHVGWDD